MRLPGFSTTTWTYNKGHGSVVEVTLWNITSSKCRPTGNPAADREGSKRLHLLPNCSLRIMSVTTDDAGLYSCGKQRKNRVTFDSVHLTVLYGKLSFYPDNQKP